MASREEITREDLRNADCEDLTDELIGRLNLEAKESQDLKDKIMRQAGYRSKPTYVKPEKEPKRKRSFFGGDSVEVDDDDYDL